MTKIKDHVQLSTEIGHCALLPGALRVASCDFVDFGLCVEKRRSTKSHEAAHSGLQPIDDQSDTYPNRSEATAGPEVIKVAR